MKVTGKNTQILSELASGQGKEKSDRIDPSRTRRMQEYETATTRQTRTTDRVKAVLRNSADVRMDRVEEVRQRLHEGRLQVDPDRLAENLLMASLKEDLEKP